MPWEDMTRLDCAYSWSTTYTFEVSLFQLQRVLELCGKYLTHLDFSRTKPSHCQFINFKADEKLFSVVEAYCRNLQILDIYNIMPTARGIAYMAEHCNRIADFRILNYDRSCNKALSIFFRKAQNLQAITFYENEEHISCLVDLPVSIIKNIHIDTLYDESCRQLVQVLRRLNLESLSMECFLKENGFSQISEALSTNGGSLKRLAVTIRYGCLFDAQPSHFTKFENLQELKLNIGDRLDDKLLEIIGKSCSQLKSVTFERTKRATDIGMKALPNLEYIDLNRMGNVNGQFLAKMSNLKRIKLSASGVTDNSLYLLLNPVVDLQFIELDSNMAYNVKVLIMQAKNVVQKRKKRIALEMALGCKAAGKEFKSDLLYVRK